MTAIAARSTARGHRVALPELPRALPGSVHDPAAHQRPRLVGSRRIARRARSRRSRLGASWGAIPTTTSTRRRAERRVLVSGAAALIIGAAPTLVNFLFQAGHGIH